MLSCHARTCIPDNLTNAALSPGEKKRLDNFRAEIQKGIDSADAGHVVRFTSAKDMQAYLDRLIADAIAHAKAERSPK